MNERNGEGAAGEGKEDVLASIRRIVAEEGDAGAAPARRDGVMPLTGAMRVAPGRSGPASDEDRPLLLTAAMRVDGGGAAAAAPPPPPPAPPIPPAVSAGGPEGVAGAPAPAADPARALRGAMSGREAPAGRAQPLTRETLKEIVRETIREELSGELGRRVSGNIKLLVEREVAKAIEALEAELAEEGRDAPAPRDPATDDGRGDGG